MTALRKAPDISPDHMNRPQGWDFAEFLMSLVYNQRPGAVRVQSVRTLAEFERDLIRERTQAGLTAAAIAQKLHLSKSMLYSYLLACDANDRRCFSESETRTHGRNRPSLVRLAA